LDDEPEPLDEPDPPPLDRVLTGRGEVPEDALELPPLEPVPLEPLALDRVLTAAGGAL
jgi:hypothetical protein